MLFHLLSAKIHMTNTILGGFIMQKNLKVWFTTPEKKIRPRSHLTWGKCENYHIYVAKKATEGCQVSFLAPENREGFTVEVAGDTSAGFKIELLREHYVSCAGALYPDPVVPDDGHFHLEENKNITYLINIVTDENTVAGEYDLKVVVKEKGELYDEYDLTVTVWNFAVKPTKLMDTAFGIDKRFITERQPSPDPDALYEKYYNMLLERYHICGYHLPYDILDERADKYLNDPKVTTFIIPYDVPDETIVAYHKKLSSNPVWFKKGFFYVVDEPCNMEAYDKIEASHARLKKLYPNYQAVSPFFKDPSDGNGVRAVDLLEKFCSIWCPKINLYKDKWFVDYMHKRDKMGDRAWWYVCWEPGLPYSNVFIDMEGFYTRCLFWQQYLHDVRGLLYWQTTHWFRGNPWDNTSLVADLSYYCFGDGSLFYTGDRVDIDGPVGSLRLELLRYGIEDFYMLEQAEEVFGREWVDTLVKNVTPSVREYNDDHDELDRTRIEIGNKLSEYYSK